MFPVESAIPSILKVTAILKGRTPTPPFNLHWWNYYLRAQTIYQVHSPFLYDFLNRIDSMFNSYGKWWKVSASVELHTFLSRWVIPLSRAFQIRQIVITGEGGHPFAVDHPHISSGWLSKGTKSGIVGDLKPTDQSGLKHNMFPCFEILYVLWEDEKDDCGQFAEHHSVPTLCMVPGIHVDKSRLQYWNHLLSKGQFHFSVEMYNLGFLMRYPTPHRPKHITFIPWQYKPWKIITI